MLEHKVHVVPVRKPLTAAFDLNDQGFDLHLMSGGECCAKHVKTGDVLTFERRGGRYELDAGHM